MKIGSLAASSRSGAWSGVPQVRKRACSASCCSLGRAIILTIASLAEALRAFLVGQRCVKRSGVPTFASLVRRAEELCEVDGGALSVCRPVSNTRPHLAASHFLY